MQLETKIVNFWTFEDGWPVGLAEYHDIGRIQAFSASLATLRPRSHGGPDAACDGKDTAAAHQCTPFALTHRPPC